MFRFEEELAEKLSLIISRSWNILSDFFLLVLQNYGTVLFCGTVKTRCRSLLARLFTGTAHSNYILWPFHLWQFIVGMITTGTELGLLASILLRFTIQYFPPLSPVNPLKNIFVEWKNQPIMFFSSSAFQINLLSKLWNSVFNNDLALLLASCWVWFSFYRGILQMFSIILNHVINNSFFFLSRLAVPVKSVQNLQSRYKRRIVRKKLQWERGRCYKETVLQESSCCRNQSGVTKTKAR
jgi:hypothetical protein